MTAGKANSVPAINSAVFTCRVLVGRQTGSLELRTPSRTERDLCIKRLACDESRKKSPSFTVFINREIDRQHLGYNRVARPMSSVRSSMYVKSC